jgi:hypothetical protein
MKTKEFHETFNQLLKTIRKTNREDQPYKDISGGKPGRPGTANGSVGRLRPTYVQYACLVEGKLGSTRQDDVASSKPKTERKP